MIAIVFGVYHSSLGIGFLLDDFYHLGYLIDAFDGENSELLKCLLGSWSGPTGLNSFRPLTSLGLMVDFVLWKTNAFGYHLTNLLMYAGCCVSVFLLVLSLLSGLGRFRFVSAFAAALLFLVYPIHPESVAWIIGRVDTQCVLFFLLSILFYFMHRRKSSIFYVLLSFLFFLASLTTKEMAVVLPVVVLAAELLLARDLGWRLERGWKRFYLPGAYFLFLGIFAFIRTSAIGTLVGGYGSSDLKTTLLMFRNFLDVETLKKIMFGVNEEHPLPHNFFNWVALAFSLSLLPVLLSLLNKRYLRLVLFLLVWLAVSLVPTFQIWHIYPNLVGSRLFFLGSVPLAILLGLAATVPFSEFPERLSRIVPPLRVVSTLSAMALIGFWTVAVHRNLEIWVRAGEDIKRIHSHIGSLASSSAEESKFIHLLDVPQDDAGAGLIGRPEYLETMLSPPIADDKYIERVLTTERCLARNREFIYPYLVREVANSDEVKHRLLWNPRDKRYRDWVLPEGINISSTGLALPLVENQATKLPVKSGDILWFRPVEGINPFSAGWLELQFGESGDSLNLAGVQSRLLYRSKHQPASWIDYSPGPFAASVDTGKEIVESLTFIPFWHRSWLLNGEIVEVGVQFLKVPDKVVLDKTPILRAEAASLLFPLVSVEDSSNRKVASVARHILLPCDSISPIKVGFDTTLVEGAHSSLIMVANSEVSLTSSPTDQLPDPTLLLFKKEVAGLKGVVAIPDNLINKAVGRHQVVVMALDAEHKPTGYLSEPRFFEICPDRPPEIK